MILHHSWPGGLAVVAESDRGSTAAVFGPEGWRLGDPRHVIPDGPPDGSTSESLDLPAWLLDQVPSLDLTWAGLHTDFVRLDRLVGSLRAEGACGVVLVLGKAPAAVVLNDGRSDVILPEGDGNAALTADGWILVFSGRLEVPTCQSPVAGPAPLVVPHAEASHPEAPRPEASRPDVSRPDAPQPAVPQRPAREPRYIAAVGTSQDLPGEVQDAIRASSGEAGLAIPGLLDGRRIPSEVAESIGLTTEQVMAAIAILVKHRLAFRYLRGSRPPVRREPSEPADRPGEV